ncbi:MAG TPA: sigma-70 family RNA polymerase sigma factor [Polyangiaceae bacterium]|jgi:RNA polymerase sigma-70 factor (ECF subfamily)|nr:sigma-70 family RNA polymerase sigma factor [Polyangiaceae bacterium]
MANPNLEQGAQKEILEDLHGRILRGAPGWQRDAFVVFQPLVTRLLLKALGPSADADELLDDVFLAFFESAGRIRDSAKVKSYLVSITMNRIRREIRHRRRRALLFKLIGTPEDVQQRPGTDDPKARAALIQLHRVLEELDADERSAFLLRNLEAMPFPEIAEVLHISESTAVRWAQRATEHVMKRVGRNALLCDYVRDRSEPT